MSLCSSTYPLCMVTLLSAAKCGMMTALRQMKILEVGIKHVGNFLCLLCILKLFDVELLKLRGGIFWVIPVSSTPSTWVVAAECVLITCCIVFLAFQSSQARISALYLPLLTIIIENKTRLQTKYSAPAPPGLAVNGDAQSELSNRWSSTLGSYTSQASLDQASLSSGLSSISQQRPAVRDPNVFSLISGQSGQFLRCLNLQPVLLNFH